MNKKVVGVLGLVSVALVGGTFAYFTQTTTIDNPFDTAKYASVVTEDFNPEDGEKWEPGAEVNKDLYVQNTGDRDVVVRVKFEDLWYRGTVENTFVHLEVDSVTNPTVKNQISSTDGLTDGDRTVVFKTFEGIGEKWSDLQSDGYFYYLEKLAPNASTGKFLDKVQLDPNTDMGNFWTRFYCTTGKKGEEPLVDDSMDGWTLMKEVEGTVGSVTAYKLEELNAKLTELGESVRVLADDESIFTRAVTKAEDGKMGYSDANYILRITVETVQATDKAVQATFEGLSPDSDIYKNWQLGAEALAE